MRSIVLFGSITLFPFILGIVIWSFSSQGPMGGSIVLSSFCYLGYMIYRSNRNAVDAAIENSQTGKGSGLHLKPDCRNGMPKSKYLRWLAVVPAIAGFFVSIFGSSYNDYVTRVTSNHLVSMTFSQNIVIDLPESWDEPQDYVFPESAKNKAALMSKLKSDDMILLIAPNEQAKIMVEVVYAPAVENSRLKNATKDFLREYSSERRSASEQFAKDQNMNILEWSDSAEIRVVNEYSAIYYSYLTTSPSGEYHQKNELFSYPFTDRILIVGYQYNSERGYIFSPILDRILRSITVKGDS